MSGKPNSSGRVFVSSTCFDLVDLRASLAERLKESGLVPVMSDRPDSEFTNPGDANSIETCLVNLRDCEHCLVILSQRYGPSLEKAGFEDVSATHLEYKEAMKIGLPVRFYVRDRLYGEFEMSKKNQGLKTLWTSEKDATRLFGFISEHAKLQNEGKSNWITPFKDATDLCQRVIGDLGASGGSAAIRMLAARGALPTLSIEVVSQVNNIIDFKIRNHGTIPITRLEVRGPANERVETVEGVQVLKGGAMVSAAVVCGVQLLSMNGQGLPTLRVFYHLPTGESLCDVFAVVLARPGMEFVLAGRLLVGRAIGAESPVLHECGSYVMVDRARVNASFPAVRPF